MSEETTQVANVAGHDEVATVIVARLSCIRPAIKVELRGTATKNPWRELLPLGSTLGELAQSGERDMLKLRGVGRRAIAQVASLFRKAGVAWVGNAQQASDDRRTELSIIVQTVLAGLARLGATDDERELVMKAIQDNKPLDGEEESDLAKLISDNIAALEDDDD